MKAENQLHHDQISFELEKSRNLFAKLRVYFMHLQFL